jgi:glycosyltransferase involved in cell wall biosynthesis
MGAGHAVSVERRIKVLALSPIPEEGAGCRFRISQYIPALEAAGFDVTLSTLYTREFFRSVYRPGHFASKAGSFAVFAARRLLSLTRVSQYDVIFLYREVFPIGPALVEWLLGLRGRPPIVFDFDDAIFLPSVSDANRLIAALKMPQKMPTIVRASARVIAGNEYLATYARRFNSHVVTIPTSVDTNRFKPRPPASGGTGGDPIVGWIGSPTTAIFLQLLDRVLPRVAAQHRFRLRVSGADRDVAFPGVATEIVEWSLAREVELFNSCDVGVYPLADDEWARGKCGFKAIQFMACGVPVVAAAIGVNCDIIQDGVNGFLASTEDEWVSKLGRLLSDPELRRRFAEAGRRTIEERYSVHVNAPRVAAVLRDAAAGGDARRQEGLG